MEILQKSSLKDFNEVRLVGEGLNEITNINEAFTRAEDLGLDLVLVSAEVKPPVVRIQDFKKLGRFAPLRHILDCPWSSAQI